MSLEYSSDNKKAARTEPPSPPDTKRLLSLDVLRGIAILLVLGNHAPLWNQAGWFQPFASLWHRAGWAGVDLFFVLSGFLIGGLLFSELRRNGKLDVTRFLIRRGFKIWPAYYLCVGAALALVLVRTHGDVSRSVATMLPNLLHYQNYDAAPRPIEHTWSLAVEEHFYLALPLGMWLLTYKQSDIGRALRPLPWIALFIMAFCLTFRCLVNTHLPFTAHTHIFYTHIRIDSLLFGVLLAYIYRFMPTLWATLTRRRGLLAVAGIALVTFVLVFDRETTPFVWTAGYTLLYLGFGSLLVYTVTVRFDEKQPVQGHYMPPVMLPFIERPKDKLARFVAWIGFYSYAIYLWHGLFAERPVEALLHSRMLGMLSLRWFCANVLYIAGAVLLGVLMGTLVDKPFLVCRDRLFPAHARAIAEIGISVSPHDEGARG